MWACSSRERELAAAVGGGVVGGVRGGDGGGDKSES